MLIDFKVYKVVCADNCVDGEIAKERCDFSMERRVIEEFGCIEREEGNLPILVSQIGRRSSMYMLMHLA